MGDIIGAKKSLKILRLNWSGVICG